MSEPMGQDRRDNSRREWTLSEIQLVRDNAHLGVHTLAQMLNRSENSIRHLASRLRISLRQRGSRRGLLLGQRRGVRWGYQQGDGIALSMLRNDVLDGETNLTELESRVREIALGSEKPTCPACGARPQTRETTGLCEVCHLRALAQAHRDDKATREAKRELWRARQESSRAKRAKSSE